MARSYYSTVFAQPAGDVWALLRDFGNSLAAFYQDMGDRMDDVVLVTM